LFASWRRDWDEPRKQRREEAAMATHHDGRSVRGHSRLWWLAAGLALSALAIRLKTRAVEAEYPPLGQFIDVDGVRLHVVVRGEGEPLVLLHGNGSNVLDLECAGLIDRAAERYRVIALDRPGFGYSERPRSTIWTADAQARLIQKALKQLGIERPIVAAHSMGTQVALALAMQFPDDVKSLALLSGYYFPSLRVDAVVNSPPALPIVGDLLRLTISPWLGRVAWPLMVRRLFAPSQITPSFRAYPVWMSLRPTALRAAAAEMLLAITGAAALAKRYRGLKVPVVIMAGTDDRYVDAGWNSVRLHGEIEGSELTLAPGAGHMVHHIVPEEVMAAIDAAAAAPGKQTPFMPTRRTARPSSQASQSAP
jgi:pimeloyl-ACP methyl ester carboxylesterase